jgi:flagellar hook-basal body complex protein FliE
MNEVATPLLKGSVRGAYNTATKLTGHNVRPQDVKETGTSTFSGMITEASKNAVQTVRESDTAMKAGLRGDIGVQEVIQATMAAESTMKTVVGVRDKLVQAYQQVLNMPM